MLKFVRFLYKSGVVFLNPATFSAASFSYGDIRRQFFSKKVIIILALYILMIYNEQMKYNQTIMWFIRANITWCFVQNIDVPY